MMKKLSGITTFGINNNRYNDILLTLEVGVVRGGGARTDSDDMGSSQLADWLAIHVVSPSVQGFSLTDTDTHK